MGTVRSGGPTWVTSSGFRLQDFLGTLYGMRAGRIQFGNSALADMRLDVVLRLPAEESERSMHQRIARALEKQLRIAIRPIARVEEVYTVTVVDPSKLPTLRGSYNGGMSHTVTEISAESVPANADQHTLMALLRQKLADTRTQNGMDIDSIEMEGGIDELCRLLEEVMGRPVLNRSGYKRSLKLSFQRNGLDRDQFLQKMETDYGLAITPAKAVVKHLIVSAAGEKQ